MANFRRIVGKPFVQKAIGNVAAEYLRLVWKTSKYVVEPPGAYERAIQQQPVIVAMWHGQHFMAPFIRQNNEAVKVLISRHRDGEMNAIAAKRLGAETIRGSGDTGGRFDLKGGVGAFMAMLKSLRDGYNIAMTADVPKIARVAGIGIIRLAHASGRPIYPIALATSRRKVLNNWDRTTINLPFSRIAITVGDPIVVPADADEAAQEVYRKTLQTTLDAIAARGYEIVDGAPRGDYRRG